MNRVQNYLKSNRRAAYASSVLFALAMLGLTVLAILVPELAWTAALPAGILASVVFLFAVHGLLRQAGEIREQQTYILTREAALATQCGRMLSFVFRSTDSSLISYRNALTADDGEADTVCPASLSEMERRLNIDEDETGRIAEASAKLKPGQTSVLTVRMRTDSGTRTLEVNLKCMRNVPDVVIGCAQDVTLRADLRTRAESEEAYMAAMRTKCNSVWQINATGGKWRCVYAANAETDRQKDVDIWRDYEKDLAGILKERIAPQDFYAYADTMSRESIEAMQRAGKTDFTLEYRVNTSDDGATEWHRQTVRIYAEPESSDVICNLYVQNVNAEKRAELERHERARVMQKSLTALGGVFFGLYYADLVNGLCYTAKARGGEVISQLCAPYPETLKAYAENYVHPADRADFLAAIDGYKLRRSMAEGSRYVQFNFRGLRGDVYYRSSMFIQPARFENGTLCDVVIALQRSEETVEAE